MIELTPAEVAARLDRGDALVMLDCREAEELERASLRGAVHVPLRDLPERATDLDPEAEYVIVCHHGISSARAAGYLLGLEFERVYNLRGGIDAWSRDVDPTIPRY